MGEAAKKPRESHVESVNSKTFTDMMQALQRSSVMSVAATAGCTTEIIMNDQFGIDVQFIRPPITPELPESLLWAQLKSTTQIIPDPKKEFFSYQFTKRQYFDSMAKLRRYPKAVLIVMTMPQRQSEWTEVTHDGLRIKRACYWAHLEGLTAGSGVKKPTVRIPMKNVFDSFALADIMDRLDRGESLRD